MDFSIAHSIELLERTPAALRALLTGLSDEWTTPNEGGETWSVYDVVGHLAYAEREAWLARAQPMLTDAADKTLAGVDRFAQFRESVGKSLEQLLDEFAELRKTNVEKLRGLDLDDKVLGRTGQHPLLGTVTLAQLLATWVVHDLDHLSQIARVLAFQYKDAVGPWQANLRITRPLS